MNLNKIIEKLKNTTFVKENVKKIYIDNDHTDTWLPFYMELKENVSDKAVCKTFFENINEILDVPEEVFVSIHSMDDIDEENKPYSYRMSTKVYDYEEE